MNPGTKVTWPQLVAEFVIYWRTKFIKNYKDIKLGPEWYDKIAGVVRRLNHQTPVICNFFPHPDDEPLVEAAFKNYFRKFKPLKIGAFKKVRFTEKNGKTSLKISKDERDIITGLQSELDDLLDKRNVMKEAVAKIENKTGTNDDIKEKQATKGKSKIEKLLELEKSLNGKNL